ncbi:MAG TPA: cytochrome c biogenesis protein CcdA, partial [Pilimelia sp.]|nr:cytochrome c biogenesis protein CcdA [Pilimelia sp.]
VAGDEPGGRGAAVGRALLSTAAMTAGFVAVFGTFGVLVTPLLGSVAEHLPWFTIGLGLVLAGLGAWLLAGRQLPTAGLRLRRGPAVTRSLPSMAAFGVAYALASLGCTIGPFLAIVASTLRAGSTWDGAALFAAYAAGMGLVVGTAALAVALARTSVLGGLRRIAPMVSRAGGALLVLAGGYVAYYGWYELRVLRGEAEQTAIVAAAGRLQRWLAEGVDRLGAPGIAAVFGALLAIGVVAAVRGRRRRADRPRQPADR